MEEKVVINGETYKKIILSLTGENSHEVLISPGQGSFSIGIKELNSHDIKMDAWVKKNDKINWDVFNYINNNPNFYYDDSNILKVLSKLNNNENKYNIWPRWFYYEGNDLGFINWSKKRKIDNFTWKPLKSMNVDMKDADINSLSIYNSKYKLSLRLGEKIESLDLYGNLNNFNIKTSSVHSLGLYPVFEKNICSYQLPQFHCFDEIKTLLIEVDVNGAAFDCTSLLQFPNVEKLHLIGNITNLESLKELKNIKKIGIWNAPNLSGFPKLNNWNNLVNFVAVNIEENAGKRLKKEISDLKKVRKFEFVSITKLRNELWFETEYNIPFSDWNIKNEEKATRAYKICINKVKKAKYENEIENAIKEFTNKINKLEDIESIERDDVYNALCIIMKNSKLKIEYDKWINWFDETREF